MTVAPPCPRCTRGIAAEEAREQEFIATGSPATPDAVLVASEV